MGGQYCGLVGDGCGGVMDCGGCAAGQTCGGAGLLSVCGAAVDSGACTPTSCTQPNGQYCGVIGNGCGGRVGRGRTAPAGPGGGAPPPHTLGGPRGGEGGET